ncbi:hypothetical protein HPB51_012824 [Rhipicephalus microplus]|uniref:Nucleoside diphosphate kinase-like domain-containing protein n=1 Tax=Rhipicephalus microplus TaxID=6941 RepID=A0A9J6EAG8_RHIMP|nr:hypothetical protein HPB51_012824 [Rhipicephalus microplus]
MCITRKLQLTLAILKPDAVRQVILENDFIFVKSKMGTYSREQMEKFYAEHQGKFFFERLASFMSSGPLSVHILAKENGIKEWRALLGPTQVFRAIHDAPNSIRARFGLTDTRNAGHGSAHRSMRFADSEESARREIGFFFPEFDQDMWYLEQGMHIQVVAGSVVGGTIRQHMLTVHHVRPRNCQ